jgi:hypothetical protein
VAKSRQSRKSAAAKRSKAARRSVALKAQGASVVAKTQRASLETPVVAAVPASAPAPKGVNLGAEYHYVLSDLRRLGLLAAASFVTLVILALIVR